MAYGELNGHVTGQMTSRNHERSSRDPNTRIYLLLVISVRYHRWPAMMVILFFQPAMFVFVQGGPIKTAHF